MTLCRRFLWPSVTTVVIGRCFMMVMLSGSVHTCFMLKQHKSTVVDKMIRTIVFSAAKNAFKSVISIFCCSVSVGNISFHFQTLILSLIVIIQWFLFDPHRDLIIIQSVWNDMKIQNKLRRVNPEELWRTTSPRCVKKPSCKATVLLKF